MQIKYLTYLLLKNFLLEEFFSFLSEKQYIYIKELQSFIYYLIFFDIIIYFNYFVSFKYTADLFNYEFYFELFDSLEFNYSHLFTFVSLPFSSLNWQFISFYFNDKLVYSDLLIKYVQRN